MVTALPCYVGLCTVATIVHAILTEYVSVGAIHPTSYSCSLRPRTNTAYTLLGQVYIGPAQLIDWMVREQLTVNTV